jgi:HAD superfamily hydrolase (TIGR01662 family)
LEGYHREYEKRGFEFTDREIVDSSWGNYEIGPESNGVIDAYVFMKDLISWGTEKMSTLKLNDGAKGLITHLNESGYKLAIVTSNRKTIIKESMKFNGIDKLFSVIITDEDVQNRKPNPEPIKKVLKRLGSKPEEAIMIGDSGDDIEAGNAAGTKTCLYEFKDNDLFYEMDKIYKLNPTLKINHFSELRVYF